MFVRAESFAFLSFSTDTADPACGACCSGWRSSPRSCPPTCCSSRSSGWPSTTTRPRRSSPTPPSPTNTTSWPPPAATGRTSLGARGDAHGGEGDDVPSSAWSRLFTELTSALKIRIDPDAEPVSLEEALSKLQQPDREVRRRTAEALTDALQAELWTRSYIFNTLLLDKATEDRRRGYPSWIASRNLSNEASDPSVQALIDAVISRYDIPQRFYPLKAQLLGLDRLADYDRMASILATSTPHLLGRGEVDRARRLLLVLAGHRRHRVGLLRAPVDRRRRAPQQAVGRLLCHDHPRVHPYVPLSFTGERRSVLMLAHELGHGVHGVLAGGQDLFNAQTPLTLAETASVFGEALTFQRLLATESDPNRRL